MTDLDQLDMTIEEFCKTHNACKEGYDWAIANCKTMTECWEKLPNHYLIWTATRPGVLSERNLILFNVFCCKEIWHLLTDERSRNAVNVAEKFANLQATKEELKIAAEAAYEAAYADKRVAVANAAYAAYVTANGINPSHSSDAAAYAAYVAIDEVYTEASAAYADEATYEERQKQADWIRSNTIPNFKKV